jgi:hypothetical protein
MTTWIGGMEAPAAVTPMDRWDVPRLSRLLLGLALGVLSLLPVYRLLGGPETGLAGAATVGMTGAYAAMMVSTFLLLLIPVLLSSRLVPVAKADAWVASMRTLLEHPSTPVLVAIAGSLAFLVSAGFARFALDGQPNLVDAMSQLVHARYIAAGHVGGAGSDFGAAWTMQQSLFTDNGWASQYPPGHILLLALGMKAGAAWVVGPLMLALTAMFTTLAAQRLVPGRIALARVAGLLVAVSPFMVAHAGAYMSHTTAAAFGAIAVYTAVRADEGDALWTLATGAALGMMFATRPLSGLVLGITILTWLMVRKGKALAHATTRLVALAAGGLPFVLLVGWWNAHFFGSPFTFGYEAALGPAGGLGFGIDPWGNAYGLTQAVAYTSAELTSLSTFLLETPLPIVPLIAAWLIAGRRLDRGVALILAWAILPVIAQLGYWHHGLFMGPRMLNESAPAWIVLAVIAAADLVAKLPARLESAPAYSPRVSGIAMSLLSLAAAAFVLAPMRLDGYRQRPLAFEAASAAGGPALVFVHGGWTSRLAMRLATMNMRLDSVETALRQNATCTVQAYADARESRTGQQSVPVTLDFERRATLLPASVEISPGNRIRVSPGENALSGVCGREAGADRLGVLDVSPLLWRGDLPGIPGAGRMFVRDLGPDRNRALMAAHPERRAFVLMTPAPDAPPRLVEYDEAMKILWGGA